jgi:hypothetical protein
LLADTAARNVEWHACREDFDAGWMFRHIDAKLYHMPEGSPDPGSCARATSPFSWLMRLPSDDIAFDQPMEVIPAAPATLVALDVEHIELADQIAEDEGAVAGHYSHPSTRNARSICAVAISTSAFSWFVPPSAAARLHNPNVATLTQVSGSALSTRGKCPGVSS